MSYTSGFFDAIDQGGGDYDRVYSAATFAHYFSLLVKNGVFPDPSTGLQVRASSSPDMKVSVSPGNGWINGYYITVPDNSPEVLTVPTANPSLSRYDSVIMGLNFVDREIQLYIKSGSVSANPSAVTLQRDSDLYELELARILVGAGVASITQSLIIDTRSDSTRCGIVAGMIDQIDTTDLFAQYDDAFQTWFADIQSQLSGNVATNLQNQINQLKTDKVSVSDKATENEAKVGESNTKWITPFLVSLLLKPLSPPDLLQSYTEAGSYTYTVPDGVTSILVAMIGGGGSGGAASSPSGGSWNGRSIALGGGSGEAKLLRLSVTPGQQIPLVVGAGASSVSISGKTAISGEQGGTTSFNGETCSGGSGGTAVKNTSSLTEVGASGGQGSPGSDLFSDLLPVYGFTIPGAYSGRNKSTNVWFEMLLQGITPFCICAGPSATPNFSGNSLPNTTLLNGNIPSKGKSGSFISFTAIKGTDPGCGGAGVGGYYDYKTETRNITSGAGCDGGVFIYDNTGR